MTGFVEGITDPKPIPPPPHHPDQNNRLRPFSLPLLLVPFLPVPARARAPPLPPPPLNHPSLPPPLPSPSPPTPPPN